MITNSMPVFWITINLADFQCLLVIRLAKVELYLDKKIKSTFAQISAIMNSIAITKFFYIICKALFVSLLTANKIKRGLLRSVSNYFAMIETNRHKMFHLYYLA